MTKTSAHSPVEPGEWALVSYLMKNQNEKRIAISAVITTSFALWTAVLLQTAVDKEVPAPNPTPAVDAPQATFPELPETDTWADAKNEPHKQRNSYRSIIGCAWDIP